MKFHREGRRLSSDHILLITTSAAITLEFKSVDEYCLLAINILKRIWGKNLLHNHV